MTPMRALAAAAIGAVALIGAGCGSTSSTSVARGAALDGAAAQLVPSTAIEFVSVNSDLSSSQWQRLDALTKSFPIRAKVLDELRSRLQAKGLTWKDDVAPALGPEVDVAVLHAKPKPDVVAFTKPGDESKLSALAAKLSEGSEHYTVQQIGGWSVVADSPDAFAAVRSAETGRSLADDATFQTAWSSISSDALVRAFAVSPAGGVAHPNWIAASIGAGADAFRAEAVVQPRETLPALAPTSLIGDVPSGADLAIAFRGNGELLQKLAPMHLPKAIPIKQLAPLLSGGGVVYVRPSGILPDVAVELAPKDPQAALASARALLRAVAAKLGPLPLTAQLSNGKLVIADSPAAAAALRGGSKLVDDAAYKDALAKAGVPAQTSFLAYADVSQLAPFVPVVVQAVTGKAPDPALAANLAHVGTVVAWGTRAGGRIQLHAWVQPR